MWLMYSSLRQIYQISIHSHSHLLFVIYFQFHFIILPYCLQQSFIPKKRLLMTTKATLLFAFACSCYNIFTLKHI